MDRERQAVGDRRALIVHHDDLGYHTCINEAYERLPYRCGSVLVTAPAVADLLPRLRAADDVGVHLTLTSDMPEVPMCPITEGRTLCGKNGRFWASTADAWVHACTEEVKAEFEAQIAVARSAGLCISHADSHMMCALRPDIFPEFLELLDRYHLSGSVLVDCPRAGLANLFPTALQQYARTRDLAMRARQQPIQTIDMYLVPARQKKAWLLRTLSRLEPGIYQLIHHSAVPGGSDDRMLDRAVRESDYTVLLDQEVQDVIATFDRITYRQMRTRAASR